MSVIHYHTPGILNTKPDLISSTDCKSSSDVIFTETIPSSHMVPPNRKIRPLCTIELASFLLHTLT